MSGISYQTRREPVIGMHPILTISTGPAYHINTQYAHTSWMPVPGLVTVLKTLESALSKWHSITNQRSGYMLFGAKKKLLIKSYYAVTSALHSGKTLVTCSMHKLGKICFLAGAVPEEIVSCVSDWKCPLLSSSTWHWTEGFRDSSSFITSNSFWNDVLRINNSSW